VFCVAAFRLPAIPKIFSNKWLTIFKTVNENGLEIVKVSIAPAYAWDGPTGVPNCAGTVLPSAFHDAIYQFCKEIMVVFGWSEREVLAWADEVFFISMDQNGANPAVKYTYFLGVRLFGYWFHLLNGLCGRRLA